MKLIDVLKKRQSVAVYEDRIPDESLVKEIIEQAHLYTPIKNNQYRYRCHVFGPEYHDDKVALMSSTACGSRGDVLQNDETTQEGYEEIQDAFFQFYEKLTKLGVRESVDDIGFNSQVLAPYLLIYTSEFSEVFTPSQWVDNIRAKYLWKSREKKYDRGVRDFNWVTQASMNALTTSLLCTENGLNSTFMGCFDYHKTDALFTLSIGYKMTSQTLSKGAGKPHFEEIVKFN